MKMLVSVIIPTFGGNPSLKRAIESVLSQSYEPFEVIVVDDNNPGTDARNATERLMQDYLEDSRVSYIKHEKNKNGAVARNTGVKNSHGSYITFLDDDDIYLSDKLSKEVGFLNNNISYDAVYCWRYQGGKIISSDMEGDLSKAILDLSFTPCTSSIMIRSECYNDLGGFDTSFRRHQDFEFLLRFFSKYSIGVVKEPLIEIIGNSVNNQLHAEKAIELKKQFLSTFADKIEKIDCDSNGFKKKVWATHYAALAVSLTVGRHFILLLRTYFQEGYKGGILFWKLYICRLFEIFKYQFTKHRKQ